MAKRRILKPDIGVPQEVAAIRAEISGFMSCKADNGHSIGSCKCGIYAFYDYENEPIYVGQTVESLRSRIGRHLTNQRTDAVAMNVLDPFEVAWIEVWPYFDLDIDERKATLDAAEYTVFLKVLEASALGAVLNEGDIQPAAQVILPKSYKQRIIPEAVFELRNHPDIRTARRAATIARLAQVISERDVSLGLRRTLLTQAQRLERLAKMRLDQFIGSGETYPESSD